MNKQSLKRIFIAFLSGLLIFSNLFSLPAYSFTSLDACFASPSAAQQCASTGLITDASAANVVRASIATAGASNPISAGGITAANALAVTGTLGALWYLKDSDMQQLRDRAIASGVTHYAAGSQIVYASSLTGPGYSCRLQCFVTNGGGSVQYVDGSFAGIPDARNYGDKWTIIPASGTSPISPSLASAANSLSDVSIYTQAAAAAAAAALAASPNDSSSSDLAAAAAAAAASFVGSSNASQADKDAVAASAAAAAASAAAAHQKDAEKAATDPSKPENVSAGRVNFVVYALQVFSSKFPFDFLYSPSNIATTFDCPSFTFFYYKWTFCFLVPLFIALRWIATIAIALKMIYTL